MEKYEERDGAKSAPAGNATKMNSLAKASGHVIDLACQLSPSLDAARRTATGSSSVEILTRTFPDEIQKIDELISHLEEKFPSNAVMAQLKSNNPRGNSLHELFEGRERALRLKKILAAFLCLDLWVRDPRVRALNLKYLDELVGVYEEVCVLVRGLNYIAADQN